MYAAVKHCLQSKEKKKEEGEIVRGRRRINRRRPRKAIKGGSALLLVKESGRDPEMSRRKLRFVSSQQVVRSTESAMMMTVPYQLLGRQEVEVMSMRGMLTRAATKRRTWVALFLLVYALLLSSSWNLLRSILSWYHQSSSSASSSSSFGLWPALYAALLFGGVFGLLSMAAALAIVIPATVVTWITVLVLLAFAGKPRRALVVEGRRITSDILSFAVKIVLKEGNIVAAASALVSFFALLRGNQIPTPDVADSSSFLFH